jgi:hypothetical protein
MLPTQAAAASALSVERFAGVMGRRRIEKLGGGKHAEVLEEIEQLADFQRAHVIHLISRTTEPVTSSASSHRDATRRARTGFPPLNTPRDSAGAGSST